MSTVSNATSQQQFYQVQQNTAKPDASGKTGSSSNPQAAQPQAAPPQTVQQIVAGSTGSDGAPESKYKRNSDGTYGPGHSALPPYNPSKPSTQGSPASSSSSDSEIGGVSVEI